MKHGNLNEYSGIQGWWFYGGRDNFEKADKSNLTAVDAGVYYPDRGISNTEIAAFSRTMHKSQGFGSTGTRGSEMEYLELIKGDQPDISDDPLSGIDVSWNRVNGGNRVSTKINALLSNFNFADPSRNIAALADIYKSVLTIEDTHWRDIKLAELEEIITACAGLYLEAKSNVPYATQNANVSLDFEMINRSSAQVTVKSAIVSGGNEPTEINIDLLKNEKNNLESTLTVTTDMAYSNPYWLDKQGTIGMYHVENHSLIGQPASKAAYHVTFEIEIGGLTLSIPRDVIFKKNDPVDGEVYAPFYIMPQASVKFTDPIYIFSNRDPKEISIIIKSFKDNFNGTLSLNHPASWIIDKESVDVNIDKKGEKKKE